MRRALVVLACVSLARSAAAQGTADVAALTTMPAVRAALESIRAAESQTIADQIRLCEIPAPPFMEAERAAAYADAFRAAGLRNVRFDEEGNVLGERPGRAARPHLVLSAHLDTVFPAGTNVQVTREGTVLRGPGIGDDCRGLAVLLAVARALDAARIETAGSITFVGTVGEEGLGDLRGVKALFDSTLEGTIDRFVSVDGSGYGITHIAVGSHRYRVTFRGPGGHSYEDFGRANPAHALGRAVAAIAEIQVPARPRTTFSVGRMGGGTSINAIPSESWMEVDLRSSDRAALEALDAEFQRAVRRAADLENSRWRSNGRVEVAIDRIGERPAGRTDAGSLVVQAALAASKALGIPAALDEGSTDANAAMHLNIPAITVGAGGLGRGAHTLQETFDTRDSWLGTQRTLLLAIALTQ